MTTWTIRAEGEARGVDADEVRRALPLLVAPDQTFEVMNLPHARCAVCRGSDVEAAVAAALDLSDGKGVYYRLNPCRPGLDGHANNEDIVGHRWLMVDCDPERPDRAWSVTAGEKAAGVAQARAIAEYLAGEDWPDPLWIDSGNGVQLLYRVDLPADRASRAWLKAILHGLADRFDTDGSKVDRGVHKPNQLAKLPGTWARKGPDTPERPHRMARLISVPPAVEAVPVERLKALAGGGPSPAAGQAGHSWGLRATGRTLDAYVRSAILREAAAVAMTPAGGRNNALNAAAFCLGTMGAWPEMHAADAKLALYDAARAAGLDDPEIGATLASGWEAGAAKGRLRPADPARNGKAPAPPAAAAPPARLIVWAKDIAPRAVDWLWPGRIPIGKATTFAGQTGMGKTFAVCDLAARVSTGGEVPCGGGECFERGKVLIVSAEDDADDTLVPRLIGLGADLSRIAFLSPEAEATFTMAALQLLNNSLDQMGDDIRLVAIDPPTSYLAGVDDHRNAELRGVLAPLRRWAIERRVAVLLITHVNKAAGANVDAMARVMGSAAWVQAVRAAHMFAPDPDDKKRSLFVPLKVNNAPRPRGLAYRIADDDDGRTRVEWLGEVETSADEAVGRLPKKSRGACATDWLAERFRERREWSSEELKRAASEAGFSKNALWAPEVNALPIRKRRRMDASGDVAWYWIADEGWPDILNGNVGNVGNVDP